MPHWFATLCLLLPLLAGGCVTHKLWTEAEMDEWNEPAGNPDLRLFHDARRDDFLVVYDEYSGRHYTTRSRAFFLRQNQPLLARNRGPQFVSTNFARQLPAVPVFCLAPTNAPAMLFAVTSTNGAGFTIHSGHRELGAYALPFYNDGIGRLERIAWTPLTVTADLTVIGGVLVLICWEGMARSNIAIPVH